MAKVIGVDAPASGGAVRPGDEELLERGRAVLRAGAEALLAIEARLGQEFLDAVQLVELAPGRVIVSGIGKSGIIARKIAATLTSTGTPANFLHPVEGMHGDLGLVGRGDVAILLSKSGESAELGGLIDHLTRFGVGIIAITGRRNSSLGRTANIVLDASVPEEACPFDLAPTTSSSAALALGDALAVALLVCKGFTREDFARLHPGGSLGRKLTFLVADVMLTDQLPILRHDATMRECVVLLAERRGTVIVVDDEGTVCGVVTAGDLTRLMEREPDVFPVPVSRVMNRSPRIIEPGILAAAAVYQMEQFGIMALPVVDGKRRPVGIVHLHDLMRAGVV